MWLMFIVPIFSLYAGCVGFHSYGWYDFLRIVVTLQAAVFAFLFYQEQHKTPAFLFAAIALLFNPIIKVRLSRSDWETLDVIVGIIFILTNLWLIKQKQQQKSEKLPSEIIKVFDRMVNCQSEICEISSIPNINFLQSDLMEIIKPGDYMFGKFDELLKNIKTDPNTVNYSLQETYQAFEVELYNAILNGNFVYRATLDDVGRIRFTVYKKYLSMCVSKGYYSPEEVKGFLLELQGGINIRG